jgi:hypothetical protein
MDGNIGGLLGIVIHSARRLTWFLTVSMSNKKLNQVVTQGVLFNIPAANKVWTRSLDINTLHQLRP